MRNARGRVRERSNSGFNQTVDCSDPSRGAQRMSEREDPASVEGVGGER